MYFKAARLAVREWKLTAVSSEGFQRYPWPGGEGESATKVAERAESFLDAVPRLPICDYCLTVSRNKERELQPLVFITFKGFESRIL
jgi:hypothetical protein